jgi:drug/metabolite transporter (DMT)-like permease
MVKINIKGGMTSAQTTLTSGVLSILMIFTEAIVSLYTVVARISKMSELSQSSIRSIVVVGCLLPFVIWMPEVISSIFSWNWVYIGAVNILHIYSSFRAFRILPTGPAMSIYYTYPILSAIMAFIVLGRSLTPWSIFGILLAFSGVIMMGQIHIRNGAGSGVGIEQARGEGSAPVISTANLGTSGIQDPGKLDINTEGILWALVAAITEALIYIFIVSGSSAYNNFFVLMIALYFWPAVFGIGQMAIQTEAPILSDSVGFLAAANLLLGVGGMTIQNGLARLITTGSYLSFSYLGVVFGYIYGLLMGDSIVTEEIVASALILGGSLLGGIGH